MTLRSAPATPRTSISSSPSSCMKWSWSHWSWPTTDSVSCPDGEDGQAQGTASGGSSEPNYQWQWTLNGEVLTGTMPMFLRWRKDPAGCGVRLPRMQRHGIGDVDRPPPLAFEALPINQYNGYAVSCPGLSDGAVSLANVEGGVGNETSLILGDAGVLPVGPFGRRLPRASGGCQLPGHRQCDFGGPAAAHVAARGKAGQL